VHTLRERFTDHTSTRNAPQHLHATPSFINRLGKAWKVAKRFGRGAVVLGGIAYISTGIYAVTKQYRTFQEVRARMARGAKWRRLWWLWLLGRASRGGGAAHWVGAHCLVPPPAKLALAFAATSPPFHPRTSTTHNTAPNHECHCNVTAVRHAAGGVLPGDGFRVDFAGGARPQRPPGPAAGGRRSAGAVESAAGWFLYACDGSGLWPGSVVVKSSKSQYCNSKTHTHTRTPTQATNQNPLRPSTTKNAPTKQILDSAKTDPRVQGLLAYLGERERFGGLAQIQELRSALIDFRVRCLGHGWEGGWVGFDSGASDHGSGSSWSEKQCPNPSTHLRNQRPPRPPTPQPTAPPPRSSTAAAARPPSPSATAWARAASTRRRSSI